MAKNQAGSNAGTDVEVEAALAEARKTIEQITAANTELVSENAALTGQISRLNQTITERSGGATQIDEARKVIYELSDENSNLKNKLVDALNQIHALHKQANQNGLDDEEFAAVQQKVAAGLPRATAIECVKRDRALREQAAASAPQEPASAS